MTRPPFATQLDEITSCFEGVIPSEIVTLGSDGYPNVVSLSVVHRVDDDHIALSRQFFNKTDRNTATNPYAQVSLISPDDGRVYLMDLVYERTEREGELFERMRTALDAVAAFDGMTNVFHLKGTDICRVLDCRPERPAWVANAAARRTIDLGRVEQVSRRLSEAADLDALVAATLESSSALLGYEHAFIMLVDEPGERLYTVGSIGFPASGTGSEVRIGEGLIGLAAARKQSVRVTHMSRQITYSHAALQPVGGVPAQRALEQVIPLPQLPSLQSQLVSPMLAHRQLVGVLCLQSETPGTFQSSDECVAGIIGNQVAMAMAGFHKADAAADQGTLPPAAKAVQVKHYAEDDSVFLDNEYLIKGIAGGVLWRLLQSYQETGRDEFSNKEIRLDQSLDLPDIKDNLEARLILLRKRLEERCDYLRLEKTARGRFRLAITRPLALVQVEGGGPL
jgi:adenylate cyclase